MKKVTIPVWSPEECTKIYRKTHIKITSGMICAGQYGKESCKVIFSKYFTSFEFFLHTHNLRRYLLHQIVSAHITQVIDQQ